MHHFAPQVTNETIIRLVAICAVIVAVGFNSSVRGIFRETDTQGQPSLGSIRCSDAIYARQVDAWRQIQGSSFQFVHGIREGVSRRSPC